MNIARGNHQKSEPGDVRQRVNFVAAANAQGTAAEEEKWNVGAERCGNFHKASVGNFAAGQPQVSAQRCGGIARTTTEATAGWNFFIEIDLDTRADPELAAQSIDRFINEIFARRLARKGLVSGNVQANTRGFGIAQPQLIVERNGLKDSAEFVISVRALAKNVQPQIYFGEGWDSDFAHAAIAA